MVSGPSQLIAEVQSGRATPQAPVYATIRPSQLPQNRPSSLSAQSSLNSLPAALNSTLLVKSVTTNEEPLRFHPTNPFYTTLPNYSSASKLPVPNGRASSIDRSKSRENPSSLNDQNSDLKSPSFFNNIYDSGPSSLPHANYKNSEFRNGFDSGDCLNGKDKSENNFYDSKFSASCHNNESEAKTGKNPFEAKRNSDPFEKYLRPESKMNGNTESNTIINSYSDNNFFNREKISKHSMLTEHQIKEIEEVKTIKKIVLNGSSNSLDHDTQMFNTGNVNATNDLNSRNSHQQQENVRNERVFNIPIHRGSDYFNTTEKTCHDERNYSNLNHSTPEDYSSGSPGGKFSFKDFILLKDLSSTHFYKSGSQIFHHILVDSREAHLYERSLELHYSSNSIEYSYHGSKRFITLSFEYFRVFCLLFPFKTLVLSISNLTYFEKFGPNSSFRIQAYSKRTHTFIVAKVSFLLFKKSYIIDILLIFL